MSETLIHPEVSDKDLMAVRAMIQGLMDDIRRQEREQELLAAINTWINAFSSFKRVRKNLGLPVGEEQKLFYGGMLSTLKGHGKSLMAWSEKEKSNLSLIGLSAENFKACVDELIEDDQMLDSGWIELDVDGFEKRYCAN
jgi:hypothetical protein